MDAEFKQIVDRIEAEGLKKDTLVIFCGDNGSSILRDKEWLYDAGIHVPLITRWPSRIKPGGLSSDLVSMLDVTAGIANLASGTVPKQMDGQPLFEAKYRGHSVIAAARGRSDEKWDAIRCIRTKEYKYFRNFMPEKGYQLSGYALSVHPHLRPVLEAFQQGKLNRAQSLYFSPVKPAEELYDIQKDPSEINNLTDDPKHKPWLGDGRAKLKSWLKSISDPLSKEAL